MALLCRAPPALLRSPRHTTDATYTKNLQRIQAILLVLAISGGLIAPLASVELAAKLPACCRRDGKHRCAMAGSQPDAAGSTPKAANARCQQYPDHARTQAVAKANGCAPASLTEVPALRFSAGIRQAESQYRISFGRSRQKRGPPALCS